MAKSNVAVVEELETHGGAKASKLTVEQQLRRSVMSCMLWEDEHYEDGVEVATRISELAAKLPFDKVAKIALEARNVMKLRHVPLWLTVSLIKAKHQGHGVGDLIANVVQRADELGELLAMYWKDQKDAPLTKQMKLGLARAFGKFDEYQLAKYDRDGQVKLRDVLFLSHARPNAEREALYKRIVERTMEVPLTWENELSAGKDKRATFEKLMAEKMLGGLAFLRNLRNMQEAGVPKNVVGDYMKVANFSKVLPFRFIAAGRAVPKWEDIVEAGFFRCTSQFPKIPGSTKAVIDVSGSMYSAGNISKRSDMTRVHAAGALVAILREVCEDVTIYATAGSDMSRTHKTQVLPSARRGMALIDMFVDQAKLCRPLGGGGIFLTQCMEYVGNEEGNKADRTIVLTDEQDCDRKLTPNKANAFGKENYLINVASHKNGIAYGKFTHIDGWSEGVLNYILAAEAQQ